MNSGAEFSECRRYRYALWRIWDHSLPSILYICLNPSTAGEDENDQTVKKLLKVTPKSGYGGFYIMNLFAIVSSDPDILKTDIDLLKDNDEWLHWMRITEKCQSVCFAWGNSKEAAARGKEIIKLFTNPLCFKINKNGSPKHPLYCKDDSVLIPFVI